MKLGELLRKAKIGYKLSGYQANIEINGIADDSRRVKRGFLFVAVKGLEHDGHDYAEQAIENGARAVVFDVNLKVTRPSPRLRRVPLEALAKWGEIKKSKFSGTTFVGVEGSRKSLGLLWAAWYGFPSRKLKVIGVTGTDGKTTTANLIYHILKTAGRKVGLISTLGARVNGRIADTGFHVTTPSPELLQKLLAKMVKSKIEYVVLEATSHGLDQERLVGAKLHTAVMTNVTHEHLDYHGTYQNYLKTKAKLFQDVSWSILNRDDRSYGYLRKLASGKVTTYGIRNSADVRAQSVNLEGETAIFTISSGLNRPVGSKNRLISLSLPGKYNVYNALAAYSACRALGLTPASLVQGLASFRGLVGRFEEIKGDQPFRVVVDFAHTPNALEQVLRLSATLRAPRSKLIVVFGCAGERDKEKRPMMGEISGRCADVSILTAEDPRREDVKTIIASIAAGCRRAGARELMIENLKSKIENLGEHALVREPDRRKAIGLAVKIARPGDIVLVTGKGHEKSMCYGTTEYPWSDQEAAREALGGKWRHSWSIREENSWR